MALEITKKSSQNLAAVEATLLAAVALLEKLKVHADEDISVFECYMKALRLPKTTDEEIASRKLAILAAAENATESPLASARDMINALELGLAASELVKANVLSDIGAGSNLIEGAIAGTLRNVDINLPQLSPAAAEKAGASRDHLAGRSQQLAEAINKAIQKRLSPML
jgi:formiminotetrahydrofolate cyclodeaminase